MPNVYQIVSNVFPSK